jgi:hypothetical protein
MRDVTFVSLAKGEPIARFRNLHGSQPSVTANQQNKAKERFQNKG